MKLSKLARERRRGMMLQALRSACIAVAATENLRDLLSDADAETVCDVYQRLLGIEQRAWQGATAVKT